MPAKAETQNENLGKYNCFVCKSLKFSSKNLLIQHMDPTHKNYVEYVFKKNHKSCKDPIWIEKSLLKLSIAEKISHLIDCKSKIEPIKDLNDEKVIANMEIPVKIKAQAENTETYCCAICNQRHFSTQNVLIEHMDTSIKKKKKIQQM